MNEEQKRLDLNKLKELRLGPFAQYLPYMEEIEKELSQWKIEKEWTYHQLREEVFKKSKEISKKQFINAKMVKDEPIKFIAAIIILSRFNTSFCARNLIQYQLCGGTIYELGSPFHHNLFLPSLDDFSSIGSFAMTELGHGSNVRGIETMAIYDEKTKEFIIHSPNVSSIKFWIGNLAQYGTVSVVFAQLYVKGDNKGVHAFVVQIRDNSTHQIKDGIEIGDCGLKLGLNGIDNGYIRFQHHRIPKENLLNRFTNINEEGEYQSVVSSPSLLLKLTLNQLKLGRMTYIASSVTAYQISLFITLQFAHLRKQFGDANLDDDSDPPPGESPIVEYQSYQRKLIPKIGECFAFEFARNEAIKLLIESNDNTNNNNKNENNNENNNNNIEDKNESNNKNEYYYTMLSGLKAYITDHVTRSLSDLRVLCGGFGYSEYNLVGELYREVDLFRTAEGDNSVLRQQLSKYVLTNFMNEMTGISGFLKYVGGEIGTAIFEKNPLVTRNCSREYLTSRSFQSMAFQYRVHSLLLSISKKLKNEKQKTTNAPSPFVLWNSCQHELNILADAYTSLFLLEQFISTIEKCDHAFNKKILTHFCSLFALQNIEDDMGFYRNEGYIGSRQGKAISELITKLCSKVAKYSLSFLSTNFPNISEVVSITRKEYLEEFLDVVREESKKFPPYRLPCSL